MENISVIIPTCKPFEKIQNQVDDIKKTMQSVDSEIIATCFDGSAAVNRNIGLNAAKYDLIVMIDDDITGFFPGWDCLLGKSLKDHIDVFLMSARLLNTDGTVQQVNGNNPDIISPIVYSAKNRLPSAAICFIKDELRFDENFLGSGWEDDDFMVQKRRKYPNKRAAINNGCKLIHANEAKNQNGPNWKHNRSYFTNKWGRI